MRMPDWLDGGEVPDVYRRLAAEHGTDLLRGLTSVRKLVDGGLSNYEAATLSKYVRGRWSAGASAEPLGQWDADKPASTSLPSFERWDTADEVDDIRIPALDPDQEDEDSQPIADLLEQRRLKYIAKAAKRAKTRKRKIEIKDQRAVAICVFGDPHLDADGCDMPEMLRTVKTVCSTPGMYALGLGDTTNGAWPGRLTKQWAHQTTTLPEQVRLARWFYTSMPFIACVLGNHDKWGDNGPSLHRYLTKGAQIRIMAEDEARFELVWPRGQTYRVVARHSFPGGSMWHGAHAAAKWARLTDGGWANAYLQGHIHQDWVSQFEHHDGRACVAGVVRGFKKIDGYADERGFKQDQHGSSLTLVLDPEANNPMDQAKVFWDVEAGADYLGWLRSRRGA